MAWLQELLSSTEELESPKSFWYWSGLAAISAVVKDQVWLNRGGAYKLYPNIYVMLLARSGLRKGPPINLAKDLVKKVNNTRIISGRSSIQGILKKLGTAYTVPGGKVMNKSVGFIIASEFTSSLVADPASMTILTDLFDRHYNEGDWESLLKMETFSLKDPTVSMLVGTNEAHFKDFIGEKDINGGFIGRMFVIAESAKHRSNSLIDDLANPPDANKLVPYLKQVAALNGQFNTLSKTEAGEHFDKWYNNIDLVGATSEDKTGTLERIGDSVLKVAMLLSLANGLDLTISMDNMLEAINVCEKLIGNIRKTQLTQGSKQTFADQKAMIIQEILGRENHIISREQLLKKYWMHFNADQLDMIMLSFEQAKLILTETTGNKLIYRMPTERANELIKYLEGK